MKSHWFEHNGKQIFLADYSGFGNDSNALFQEMEPAIKELARQADKSTLVLANLDGTSASMMNASVFRNLLPQSNHAVLKRAVVGLSGAGRVFMNTLNNVMGGTPARAFDKQEDALDWLVAE
jgi:hypothetical protein